MDFWQEVILIILGVVLTGSMAMLSWIVIRVHSLQKQVAMIEIECRTRIDAITCECTERLTWIRSVAKRQDEIAEHLASIKGMIEADRSRK